MYPSSKSQKSYRDLGFFLCECCGLDLFLLDFYLVVLMVLGENVGGILLKVHQKEVDIQ